MRITIRFSFAAGFSAFWKINNHSSSLVRLCPGPLCSTGRTHSYLVAMALAELLRRQVLLHDRKWKGEPSAALPAQQAATFHHG